MNNNSQVKSVIRYLNIIFPAQIKSKALMVIMLILEVGLTKYIHDTNVANM